MGIIQMNDGEYYEYDYDEFEGDYDADIQDCE